MLLSKPTVTELGVLMYFYKQSFFYWVKSDCTLIAQSLLTIDHATCLLKRKRDTVVEPSQIEWATNA